MYGIMTAILGICLLFVYPVVILSIAGIGFVIWFFVSNWESIKAKFLYILPALIIIVWLSSFLSGITRK